MYININTKETTNKIELNNVSLPNNLSEEEILELGFSTVIITDRPEYKNGRIITVGEIVESEGTYTQTWNIDDSGVDLMGDLRSERDYRLMLTDYTQATDNTEEVEFIELWATYRQELRDLPSTADINNIIWPVGPDNGTATD